MEPVAVRRVLPVLHQVVKSPEAAAAMIEDTVQHETHAALMNGGDQGIKSSIAPQQRIDRQVVVGVIAMIRCGAEDRRQVQTGDAHVPKFIERLDHPVEVTSLKPLLRRVVAPWFEVQRALVHDLAAATETVRKNLIEHRLRHPVGGIVEGDRSSHDLCRRRSPR